MTPLPSGTQMYGKGVEELQSGVRADSEGVLHGTLHFVTGYKDFNPGNPAEQSGNYVAMHIHTPIPGKVTIKSSTMEKPKELEEGDRDLVWRVQSKEATLTVTVEGEEESGETIFKASGLTLEPGD